MTKQITLTMADKVHDEIIELMQRESKSNKSEYIEELIRVGLLYREQEKPKKKPKIKM